MSSFFDWEESFKKKKKDEKEDKENSESTSIGVPKSEFKDFLHNWKKQNNLL